MQIATAISAKSRLWKNINIDWEQFVKLLELPKMQPYSMKEYLSFPKDKQAEIKDVGGYVGGYLKGGRRKSGHVSSRSLLTLDIDNNADPNLPERLKKLGFCHVIHGTFKHTPENPRYRILAPLDKAVEPDAYEAIARKIADLLGLEQFDPTTFEAHRLMYWPSIPSDSEYFFVEKKGKPVDTDRILAMYHDWKECSEWPTHKATVDRVRSAVAKQQDPTEKRGLIGSFCKAYTMTEAIETHLSNYYSPTDQEDRYTYINGQASAGLIVYDDLFAYSHHGTDPCSGKLCNAFDLVRIHLFGENDNGEYDTVTKAPSYKAMCDFVQNDRRVTRLIIDENKADFEDNEAEESPDDSWKDKLTRNKTGVESTAGNISVILANDVELKGKFYLNEFDSRKYVKGDVPWRKTEGVSLLLDVDEAGVRNYLDRVYNVTGVGKITDAFELEIYKHRIHPVRDYLNSLEWDGIERLDTLLVDYLAADDTKFNRLVIRKALTAAVARVYNPGCKFDYVLTLVGSQGAGKSTFGRKLCSYNELWFNDSFKIDAQGNAVYEQLQGAWISEMAEMSGYKKADINSTKQFISKQSDSFRPAYGKNKQTFLRQGIIIATVNEEEFLRDPTGDRRFWPVRIDQKSAKKDIHKLSLAEANQIWAEAKKRYFDGETLYLDAETEKSARLIQRSHAERDSREGVIEAYLDKLLPENWASMDLFARREYLQNGAGGTIERQFVCTAEIWCECFGKAKEDMSRYNTRDINDMMRSNPMWAPNVNTKDFGIYGRQKYYERKL